MNNFKYLFNGSDRVISVIIPVYNVEEYLHICLNSILKQTFQDFEIICIDDASTDSSSEILEYFAQKDSRIKILKNEKNIGLGPSRNRGMDASVGKYIIFLDSDDWYSFDTLETFFHEAEENNLDMVMGKPIVFYENQKFFGMEEYYDAEFMNKFDHKVFNHWDLDKTKLFHIPIAVWNKLYLKSFLDENNIRFPDEDYIHEDNPFSCKVITRAKRISLINKYFYNRRRRPGSLMTLNDDRLFDNIPIVYLILEVFLEDVNIYNYYKKEVLVYIFKSVLNSKYHKIEDQYKEKFFKEVQGVYKRFIIDYGLYNDIKENVDKNILDFFKFEDIVKDFSSND